MIATWDLPAGPETVLMADAAIMKVMDRVEVLWGDLCRKYGPENGLPDGVCQAHIGRESNGYPRAFRQERHPDGSIIVSSNGRPLTGCGLMQITNPDLKGNLTDEELFNPDTNVRIGSKYLGWIWSKQGGDFVKASATFNAGSPRPSDKNPWNLVQAEGHVTWEVQAYNYWLSKYANANASIDEQNEEAQRAFDLAFTTEEAETLGPHAGPLREDT